MGVVAPNNNADARAAAIPADSPKYVLLLVSRISTSYGIAGRARRWGSICRSEYPDGSRILRSPNGQKKPIDLRHPKRRPRTGRGCKMRYSDEAIRLRSEYIQKPLVATDVNQATLCVHKQVIGVAASLNSMRHSAVPKVEGGKLRRMPKHGQDLLTFGIDRERRGHDASARRFEYCRRPPQARSPPRASSPLRAAGVPSRRRRWRHR